MNTENVEWLNHLKEAVSSEGYGNKLSMYLIALEAWRRGIKVKFFTIDNPENKVLIRYSLEHNGKAHHFESSLGDKLSPEAFDVCEYKDLTKKYLSDVGVKVPEGKVFSTSTDENIYTEFATSLGFPVVIKPLDENAGKGVFSNIDSKENLLDVIRYLKEEMNYEYIMIEEFISGDEYRILTVNNKVEGAVKRIPANIIGNGKDDIGKLIKRKNRSRLNNPSISKKRIKIDKEVNHNILKNNYTLDSILDKGEQLFLRGNSNVSTGGDPVEVTEQLSVKVKAIAEKASQVIPGLNVAGVDMIINPETDEATIIEVNTKPGIWLHIYPVEGQAKDVVKSIVDLYFPETKDFKRSNLHFDFETVIEPLDNVTVHEIQVSPLKKSGIYYTKEFIINLEEPEPTLTTEIRLEALKIGIHGYVKKIDTNQYRIVAASQNEETMKDFIEQFSIGNEKFSISSLDERDWDYSVDTGFDIYKETVKDLNEKFNKQENKLKKLSTDMKNVQSKLESERKETQQKQEELLTVNEKLQKLKEKYNSLNEDYVSATLKSGEIERAFISSENLLTAKLKTFESEYDKLWKKYKETVNSKSWKLTKPLRKYNIRKFKR